jgi:hypothetical protein
MHLASTLFLSLTAATLSSSSIASEITIQGSVQFWERACSATYACELPVAVSPRIEINNLIQEPEDGTRLSSTVNDFSFEGYNGKLSVFWNLNNGAPYLAGQSFLSRDGLRIAECSHFAKADVKSFFPVGFCSGYVNDANNIKQYGMTFYK